MKWDLVPLTRGENRTWSNFGGGVPRGHPRLDAPTLVKFEADNCFATFVDVRDAVRAAIALNQAFARANFDTPEDLDIRICCGIDFGKILLIEQRDFFGDPVNRACKLGEDLADPGEILVTRAAMERLDSTTFDYQNANYVISGIGIDACSVRY